MDSRSLSNNCFDKLRFVNTLSMQVCTAFGGDRDECRASQASIFLIGDFNASSSVPLRKLRVVREFGFDPGSWRLARDGSKW